VLHDQEAVVVLLQYGHELERGEGPAHVQLGDVPVQAAENAGVVAADEEDFVALQIKAFIEGIDLHLRRCDKDIEGLRKQGDCWMQFDLHR